MGEKFVVRYGVGLPLAFGHFKEGFQSVGKHFVGPEDPEIPLRIVQLRHVAQKSPKDMRVANTADPGRRHVDRVATKIRQSEIPE